jgi:hypothetical protein
MSVAEIASTGKPHRRNAKPENVSLVIERVENLTLELKNAAAIAQLIDGLDRRLALIEEGMPSVGMLTAPSGRLARIEKRTTHQGLDALRTQLKKARSNGHTE